MRNATRCTFEFAPGVRCEKAAGHDEPYYPYLDYGQWGEYSDLLSEGSQHEVRAPAKTVPPRSEWTGSEPKDKPDYFTACNATPENPLWHRCIREKGHDGEHLTDRDHAGKSARWAEPVSSSSQQGAE